MTKRKQPDARPKGPEFPFEPVVLRFRHDGWTAERQAAFIQALAECGCVAEACGRVGQSVGGAYGLRARPEARSFRAAWDAALAHAIQRLSDAAFARALHGVSRPVFYRGEQVGENRHYDERLTTFLLRYRDPDRYRKWNDRMIHQAAEPEGAVPTFAECLLRILEGDEGSSKMEVEPEVEGDVP